MGILDNLNFNAADVEPSTGFDPLPEGVYQVMVNKAVEKPTKSGSGVQLVVEFRVLEGKYAKRVLFSRINLQNQSPECVKIGRAELSAFCRAVGVMTPKAPHEFANRTCLITVKIAQRSDGKGLTNEVVKFEPMGGALGGLVQGGTSSPSQPAPAAAAPWAAK